MAALSLQHVGKTYPGPVRAVVDFSLEVADGELLVLVGPSGCGKTTLLRMIAGLEPVTSGSIHLGGRALGGLPPKDRDVALVFQNCPLMPHLSVYGNLAFALRLRRLGKAEIEQRVREAAGILGIGDLLGRRPGELSGGQRQRVALGRALVRRPRLFLFDEPLSNLDAPLRSQMRGELRRLHARLGVTTVHVTHDQTEALTLGQRIAAMGAGRLQQVADPVTLYHRPANRFVAGLIGSPAMNFFEGRVVRGSEGLVFEAGELRLPLPTSPLSPGGRGITTTPLSPGGRGITTTPLSPGGRGAGGEGGHPVTIGVRPEHLRLAGGGQPAGGPAWTAAVEAVEPAGPESYVYLRTLGHIYISRGGAASDVRPGDRVALAVECDHLHFFDAVTGAALA